MGFQKNELGKLLTVLLIVLKNINRNTLKNLEVNLNQGLKKKENPLHHLQAQSNLDPLT